MSRLRRTFAAAKKDRRAAFVAYVTAGDPDIERTVDVARALHRAGVDVLELGVPFSDPIADGPTNQQAAERALAAGTSLRDVLGAVAGIRAAADMPVVLFTYGNPVLRYGVELFASDAAAAGVDGVLFTDVPAEEVGRFRPALRGNGLDLIMLVAPTSTRARVKAAQRLGGGFLYFVSRTGVTGAKTALSSELESQVRAVRAGTRLPVAVGFGISTPGQVAQVARIADGVVVGSAIVEEVRRHGDSPSLAESVERFVVPLVEACRR